MSDLHSEREPERESERVSEKSATERATERTTETEPERVDPRRVADILGELVRLPSVNPALGGPGEGAVTAYVAQFLRRLGLAVEVQPVEPGRDNVIGTLPGASALHLLLEAHMDTVQTDGMTIEPYGAERRDGRLYGRGACDTKASLAAMLAAVETMAERRLVPAAHVHLAAVVDEETTYRGIAAMADEIADGRRRRYDAAIVGEPTELQLIAAHNGVVRFYLESEGRAAHTSTPQRGVNAIEGLLAVLGELRRQFEDGRWGAAHPLTGPPTFTVTGIEGGTAPNTVADRCRARLDCRLTPGMEPRELCGAIGREAERLVRELGLEPLRIAASEPFIVDYAMEVDSTHPLVGAFARILQTSGHPERILGAPYCSDASKLVRVGVPTLVFGPGSIAQAHTADEWVELEQVSAAADALLQLALDGWEG
ncbi:M20 family metallopeptidase [Paenibacillus sp. IB182496]|uniref:M20 family metallopeptidase n=1 Tax=Paenibacillus sabuli TaxID=2772509 RepID=A0A927GRY3_9BACL|nr:M20 family metallopeptidase [Paenibacillus sabuli]MBD2845973.1 M20 family metallopeptidase [Paenibacillus sabuli]